MLAELTAAHPAWPGAALIDPSRIAMAGHSAAGAAAIAAAALSMASPGHIPAASHAAPGCAGWRPPGHNADNRASEEFIVILARAYS